MEVLIAQPEDSWVLITAGQMRARGMNVHPKQSLHHQRQAQNALLGLQNQYYGRRGRRRRGRKMKRRRRRKRRRRSLAACPEVLDKTNHVAALQREEHQVASAPSSSPPTHKTRALH